MVVLSYTPENATKTNVWVGKGIMYDTGGLSLKGGSNMTGMKRDMGGAAAIFNAFIAAVKTGSVKTNLHAILCLGLNYRFLVLKMNSRKCNWTPIHTP